MPKNNALKVVLVHYLLNEMTEIRLLSFRMTMNMSIYRPLGDFPDGHHPKDTTQNERTQLKMKVQTTPFHERTQLKLKVQITPFHERTQLKLKVQTTPFQEGHLGAYFLIHFLLDLSK